MIGLPGMSFQGKVAGQEQTVSLEVPCVPPWQAAGQD